MACVKSAEDHGTTPLVHTDSLPDQVVTLTRMSSRNVETLTDSPLRNVETARATPELGPFGKEENRAPIVITSVAVSFNTVKI